MKKKSSNHFDQKAQLMNKMLNHKSASTTKYYLTNSASLFSGEYNTKVAESLKNIDIYGEHSND